jgi:hypothetical protein
MSSELSQAKDSRAILAAAVRLHESARLDRWKAEAAWAAWEITPTLTNAIRRDDAKRAAAKWGDAEDVARWVIDRLRPRPKDASQSLAPRGVL